MNALDAVNNIIYFAERKGWIKRTPAFIYDYGNHYSQLNLLEENADKIHLECVSLLKHKLNEIPKMEGIAGNKTVGGIHSIKWKSFMLKSGNFIAENCHYCPVTTDLLRKIPRVKQAFFSILEPNQHIKPHFGYYRGFLRYHLGVIIPYDNIDKKCWIRINDNPEDNLRRDKLKITNSEIYHWKNGEGIMFNDYYLHDAANESDQIRVVLFLDIVRKFPFWFDWFNWLVILIGYRTKEVKQIATNARLPE